MTFLNVFEQIAERNRDTEEKSRSVEKSFENVPTEREKEKKNPLNSR